MSRQNLDGALDYLRRYPRICAHIIAESLGYATPRTAATILRDAVDGKPNYCEWILSCYGGDAHRAVEQAIRHRRHHEGYMASYRQALTIIRHELDTGEGPLFASWF